MVHLNVSLLKNSPAPQIGGVVVVVVVAVAVVTVTVVVVVVIDVVVVEAVEQVVPEYPALQLHLKPFTWSLQLAPFLQGLFAHSLMFVEQVVPENPALQLHL